MSKRICCLKAWVFLLVAKLYYAQQAFMFLERFF